MNAKLADALMALPFAVFLFILPFRGTVALRLLCLSAAIIIAVRLWRRLDTPRVPCKPVLFAWAGLALLSLGYAVDPAYSLGEIKNELGYTMTAFVAFFAMTHSRAKLQLWALAVLCAVTVISVWALVLWQGRGSWDDSAGHGGVGSFASLAVVAAPLAVLAWQGMDRRARLGLAAVCALALLAAIASQQRILWVVLGVQLALTVGLLSYSRILRLKPFMLALIAAASLTAAGAAVLTIHSQKVDQSPVEYYDLSNDFRLQQWGRIMDRIQENPWSGAGFGRESMKKAYPDLVPTVQPMSLLWHPHNVVLTYGVAMGYPGMLLLLAVFAALIATYAQYLRAASVDERMIAIAGIAIVIGILVRNMTNDLFVRDGALMFWALNGALLGLLSRQRRDDQR
jgi:O-antigen ligase